MKWEMENEEIQAVVEKIWDLHNKLSDAIHSISRTHFVDSLKTPIDSCDNRTHRKHHHRNHHNHHHNNNNAAATTAVNNHFPAHSADEPTRTNGFVYVKDKDYDKDSAIAEAKSLDAIRSALENLEDQLEFFHTVQLQQQAERDAAIARIEQSRIILALRLSEHHGRRYKVIEEALDFVGDVKDATYFVSPESLSGPSPSAPADQTAERRRNSNLGRVFLSGLVYARNALKLETVGGMLGNAALFTISMLAMVHLHQMANKDSHPLEIPRKRDGSLKRVSQQDGSSSQHLDVWSARG